MPRDAAARLGASRWARASVVFVLPVVALWLLGVRPDLAETHVVEVFDFAFEPQSLQIDDGDRVRWQVRSGTHSATSNAELWDSGPLDAGDTFELRFEDAGDFSYFCTPHDFMRGDVRVAPSGVAERWGFWLGLATAGLLALGAARTARAGST